MACEWLAHCCGLEPHSAHMWGNWIVKWFIPGTLVCPSIRWTWLWMIELIWTCCKNYSKAKTLQNKKNGEGWERGQGNWKVIDVQSCPWIVNEHCWSGPVVVVFDLQSWVMRSYQIFYTLHSTKFTFLCTILQNEIVEALKKHLMVPDSMALPSLLE